MTKTDTTKAIHLYLKEIAGNISAGYATEHTFRPALKSLLESLEAGISVTNEPKRVACGAPDYIITRGMTPLGYIEAKDVGKNLDEVEKSEQMIRYLEALPNLILTDYVEFRWYSNRQYMCSVRLANVSRDGQLRKEPGTEDAFVDLFANFLASSLPVIETPKALAACLAGVAILLRTVISSAFSQEDPKTGALHSQLEAFRQVLLHKLEYPQFADMYAQTLCYGLFAARCNHDSERGPFTRQAAAYDLPETNPFLRQMFHHLAGPHLDERIVWVVDHIADLLHRADIAEILRDFGKRTRQEDPVVHFYETFLSAYDPTLREKRGVYYTPEPVVSYLVRSVDEILRRDFGIPDGLACSDKIPLFRTIKSTQGKPKRERIGETHRVLILDPATGTGTFLYKVIDCIHERLVENGQGGAWDGYVSRHLLPRLFGFELLMAPYTVAHMKLGLKLAQTGYKFQSGERLRVYLTNTLEEAFDLHDLPLFAAIIAQEANEAGKVKTQAPVMVILGNPPYSGHSANESPWIADLLRGQDTTSGHTSENYFEVDGKPLGERNPKWINDDYVKFIRFSQWRIERTGYGILAFITNHGYLDNPTFRGMRQSLMRTFDDIYVLDLHGNVKKKETAPDGSKDENVFDIQQGVAICLMVKRGGKRCDTEESG